MNAACPAAAKTAAVVGAAAGAGHATLASEAVWGRLTSALLAHDWHAARAAKHDVEEAQRVRWARACDSFRSRIDIRACRMRAR